MAKRASDSSLDLDVIEVRNAFIKGYQEHKIKLPVGTRVEARIEEASAKRLDENAVICFVPDDLDEQTLDTTMSSKSAGTSYKIRDVVGKTVGQVQYFLSGVFWRLLVDRKVSKLTGVIDGLPLHSKKPKTEQRWVKNKQAGGGVVIPVTWHLEVAPTTDAASVTELVRASLPEVEGHEDMEIVVRSSRKRSHQE